eukprot:1970973-Pleurochrysis_carterae.AAC.1
MRRRLESLRALAERVGELGLRVSAGEAVGIPATLLNTFSSAEDDASGELSDQHEVAREVRWRAHPERHSAYARLRRSYFSGGPNRTLMTALDEVKVDGRHPSTEQEWRRVEQRLELQVAAAALIHQWKEMGKVAEMPALPATNATEPLILASVVRTLHAPRLAACVAAAEAVAGIGELANRAVPAESGGGAALLASLRLTSGAAECDVALEQLGKALKLHSAELTLADRLQRTLIRELDRSADDASHHLGAPADSPLARLKESTLALGSLEISSELAARRFLESCARLREARAAIAHVSTLRALARRLGCNEWSRHLLRADPTAPPPRAFGPRKVFSACPPDARRLWAA